MSAKIDGTNGLLQQYDYQVLTTGFSYTFAAGTTVLMINPAGTLAAGTIIMPASPADGMTITFSSTKTITALTLSGNTGQSVVSAVTTLPANQSTTYFYNLNTTSWYPMSTVATNVPVAPAGGSIITSGTAVASTSGTSIDFTSIPSWVKRITVMFNAVSTSGTSNHQVQVGSGSVTTTGYSGYNSRQGGSTPFNFYNANSAGFIYNANGSASTSVIGTLVLTLLTSNTWVASGQTTDNSGSNGTASCIGAIALSGALDRVRITTVNGTDTFDAGTVNILYE